MARDKRIRRKHPAVELNITAFMNLMVVLVPFLLMTAVFSHITIRDLELPPPGSADKQDPKNPPYELRITIRKDALIVSDNKGGLIKRIPKTAQEQNYAVLRETLKMIKSRFPDKTNITILSEADTPYNDMIQVMDSSRSYATLNEEDRVFQERFPALSMGVPPK